MEVLQSAPVAVRFLIFTGMPVAEVINLKWDSVDFEMRVLRQRERKPQHVAANDREDVGAFPDGDDRALRAPGR